MFVRGNVKYISRDISGESFENISEKNDVPPKWVRQDYLFNEFYPLDETPETQSGSDTRQYGPLTINENIFEVVTETIFA